MKFFLMMMFLTSPLFAQDSEADLQIPVEDISQIQKEEEQQIPTLEEVEMKNNRRDDSDIRPRASSEEEMELRKRKKVRVNN